MDIIVGDNAVSTAKSPENANHAYVIVQIFALYVSLVP